MKFAHYDSDGLVTFYAPEHLPPTGMPEPYIEVSDEDWARHVSGGVFWRVDTSDPAAGPKLVESTPPALTLEERKEAAIAEAQSIASDIRRKVAENASVERALSWVNKVPYAAFWKLHEDGGDPAGPFAGIAAEAEAGFQIEADVKNTTAIALRDRTLAKNATFFRATQLVEGMEGLAETVIPAAANDDEFESAITHLQTLQAQAMVQLDAITSA